MARGLITRSGRILTARLLFGETIDGITHCAIGDGDATFTNPTQPPEPSIEQTGLLRERARKRLYKKSFLVEDPTGGLLVNGVRYHETGTPTQIIAFYKISSSLSICVEALYPPVQPVDGERSSKQLEMKYLQQ